MPEFATFKSSSQEQQAVPQRSSKHHPANRCCGESGKRRTAGDGWETRFPSEEEQNKLTQTDSQRAEAAHQVAKILNGKKRNLSKTSGGPSSPAQQKVRAKSELFGGECFEANQVLDQVRIWSTLESHPSSRVMNSSRCTN